MIFGIFSRIFTQSWISAQKQANIAILLKTASVRVSCIQIAQIRGETIAKVFGKVDTFWTYQGWMQETFTDGEKTERWRSELGVRLWSWMPYTKRSLQREM